MEVACFGVKRACGVLHVVEQRAYVHMGIKLSSGEHVQF
jgi:hypothetical protein